MKRKCQCSGPCTPPAGDVTRREFMEIVGAGAAGAPVAARLEPDAGGVVVTLAAPVAVKAGETLAITVA